MTASSDVTLVVLDFDGTLCDSAGIKSEAYYELYMQDSGPTIAEQVRSFHLDNPGRSRFEVIEFAEFKILERDPSPVRVQYMTERFGQIVEARVIDAPLLQGVDRFLSRWAEVLPLTVASATPTDELRRIVRAKRMRRYFASVDGAPEPKSEIVSRHIALYGDVPERTIVVGDQRSDYLAANAVGTDFVLMGQGPATPNLPGPSFSSFDELGVFLGERRPLQGGSVAKNVDGRSPS